MPQNLSVILGAQWGDEGKGKLVDFLAPDYDFVVRATGGANAGHTVYAEINGTVEKIIFHLLPSGLVHPHVKAVIGNGCVLHIPTLMEEIDTLKEKGLFVKDRLFISDRASLLFEYHKIIDGSQEDSKGTQKVGTTRRGIGPCYSDKINRRGLRLCDLADWDLFVEKYKANVAWHQKIYGFDYDEDSELAYFQKERETLLGISVNATYLLNNALEEGKKILLEGANAALLDIDHGTYPYVTSSNPTIGGVFSGTGMNARHLGAVMGGVKAYMTRVGSGPFPTELTSSLGDKLREAGGEYGSTTGRPRRCGWFDVPLTRYAILLNGFTSLNLTKLDVLDDFDEIQVATGYSLHGKPLDEFPARLKDLAEVKVHYESLPGWKTSLQDCTTWDQLPEEAKNYVLRLEKWLKCPIEYIGVGKRRDQLIVRPV